MMRSYSLFLLVSVIAFCLALGCSHAIAQQKSSPAFGIAITGSTFLGDINYQADQALQSAHFNINPGIHFRYKPDSHRRLSPFFSLSLGRIISETPYTPTSPEVNTYVETSYLVGDVGLALNLIRKPAFFRPSIMLGIGGLFYSPKDKEGIPLILDKTTRASNEGYSALALSMPATLNLEFRINHQMRMHLAYTFRFNTTDYLDNISQLGTKAGNDQLHTVQVGLDFVLKHPAESESLEPIKYPLELLDTIPSLAILDDSVARQTIKIQEQIQETASELATLANPYHKLTKQTREASDEPKERTDTTVKENLDTPSIKKGGILDIEDKPWYVNEDLNECDSLIAVYEKMVDELRAENERLEKAYDETSGNVRYLAEISDSLQAVLNQEMSHVNQVAGTNQVDANEVQRYKNKVYVLQQENQRIKKMIDESAGRRAVADSLLAANSDLAVDLAFYQKKYGVPGDEGMLAVDESSESSGSEELKRLRQEIDYYKRKNEALQAFASDNSQAETIEKLQTELNQARERIASMISDNVLPTPIHNSDLGMQQRVDSLQNIIEQLQKNESQNLIAQKNLQPKLDSLEEVIARLESESTQTTAFDISPTTSTETPELPNLQRELDALRRERDALKRRNLALEKGDAKPNPQASDNSDEEYQALIQQVNDLAAINQELKRQRDEQQDWIMNIQTDLVAAEQYNGELLVKMQNEGQAGDFALLDSLNTAFQTLQNQHKVTESELDRSRRRVSSLEDDLRSVKRELEEIDRNPSSSMVSNSPSSPILERRVDSLFSALKYAKRDAENYRRDLDEARRMRREEVDKLKERHKTQLEERFSQTQVDTLLAELKREKIDSVKIAYIQTEVSDSIQQALKEKDIKIENLNTSYDHQTDAYVNYVKDSEAQKGELRGEVEYLNQQIIAHKSEIVRLEQDLTKVKSENPDIQLKFNDREIRESQPFLLSLTIDSLQLLVNLKEQQIREMERAYNYNTDAYVSYVGGTQGTIDSLTEQNTRLQLEAVRYELQLARLGALDENGTNEVAFARNETPEFGTEDAPEYEIDAASSKRIEALLADNERMASQLEALEKKVTRLMQMNMMLQQEGVADVAFEGDEAVQMMGFQQMRDSLQTVIRNQSKRIERLEEAASEGSQANANFVSDIETERDLLTAQNTKMREKLDKYQREVDRLERENQSLQEQIDPNREFVTENIRQMAQQQETLDRQKAQLTHLIQANDSLLLEWSKLNGSNAILQDSIARFDTHISEMDRKLQFAQSQESILKAESKRKLDSLSFELDRMERQMENAGESQQIDAERFDRLAEKEQRLGKYEDELKDLGEVLNRREAQLAQRMMAVEREEAKRENLKEKERELILLEQKLKQHADYESAAFAMYGSVRGREAAKNGMLQPLKLDETEVKGWIAEYFRLHGLNYRMESGKIKVENVRLPQLPDDQTYQFSFFLISNEDDELMLVGEFLKQDGSYVDENSVERFALKAMMQELAE